MIYRSWVPVLVSLLSFFQERGSVSSWISWFLFVLAGVPVLVSLLLSSSFLRKRVLFHGLVLALLFSRENSLYQFWTRLNIKDLHSVWIPGCVGAFLLLPRICTVEVMKE